MGKETDNIVKLYIGLVGDFGYRLHAIAKGGAEKPRSLCGTREIAFANHQLTPENIGNVDCAKCSAIINSLKVG